MLIRSDCPYFDECVFNADIKGYDLICAECELINQGDEEEEQ